MFSSKSRFPITSIRTRLTALFVAIFGLVLIGYSGLLYQVFVGSQQREFDAVIPGVILTAVAFLLLLSSFGVALGSLFLTSDLELLMTAPVRSALISLAQVRSALLRYAPVRSAPVRFALVKFASVRLVWRRSAFLRSVLLRLALCKSAWRRGILRKSERLRSGCGSV